MKPCLQMIPGYAAPNVPAGSFSSLQSLQVGLPQGSALEPLFLFIHTHSLGDLIQSHGFKPIHMLKTLKLMYL